MGLLDSLFGSNGADANGYDANGGVAGTIAGLFPSQNTPTSTVPVGDYQMPQIGTAGGPLLGDSLGAGIQSLAGSGGGLVNRLSNAYSGLTTGQTTYAGTPQHPQQQQQQQAASGAAPATAIPQQAQPIFFAPRKQQAAPVQYQPLHFGP